jgi:hypothetical protein
MCVKFIAISTHSTGSHDTDSSFTPALFALNHVYSLYIKILNILQWTDTPHVEKERDGIQVEKQLWIDCKANANSQKEMITTRR